MYYSGKGIYRILPSARSVLVLFIIIMRDTPNVATKLCYVFGAQCYKRNFNLQNGVSILESVVRFNSFRWNIDILIIF